MNYNKLKEELNYFIKNQEELVNLYKDKFIVIKDKKVLEQFDTEEEAYNYLKKNKILGKALIQECKSGKEAYTAVFHSNISF